MSLITAIKKTYFEGRMPVSSIYDNIPATRFFCVSVVHLHGAPVEDKVIIRTLLDLDAEGALVRRILTT